MMIKTAKLLLILLMIGGSMLGQKPATDYKKLYVPYKVGDKFGIATYDGTLKLQPQYDYVALTYEPNVFTAYNYEGSGFKSALIVNDKVLLQDKMYFGYYPYGDIIVAVAKAGGEGSGYYSFAPESMHLYDRKGKLIMDEAFSYASVLEDIDQKRELQQTMLSLHHTDETYSVVSYDKKTKKLETWIDKAKDVEFVNLEMVYHTKEFHINYVDAENKGHELKIGVKDGKFVKTYEGTYIVEPEGSNDLYGNWGDVAVPNWEEEPPAPKVEPKEITMKTIELKEHRNQFSPPWIEMGTKELDPIYSKLVFEDNKKGLLDSRKNELRLPTDYDEIYEASFRGIHANGYILFNNGVYALKIYEGFNAKEVMTKGTYTHRPFVAYFKYGREDVHLVSLFDDEGKFMYYANQDGVVYYKD